MTSSGEETWSQQDEELYVQLRRKHDRIYAKKRRDKKRVYPYIPRNPVSRKKIDVSRDPDVSVVTSAPVVSRVVKSAGRGQGQSSSAPEVSTPELKKCFVCHRLYPVGELDLRGRCKSCH